MEPSVIADARAAFERLVKRSIEAAREQRPAPTLFAPETPHRPQPQLPPEARLRGLSEKIKSAKASVAMAGGAEDSSRRHGKGTTVICSSSSFAPPVISAFRPNVELNRWSRKNRLSACDSRST